MTTPQNTPAGKHRAQDTPSAGDGNGKSGVPLVRLVHASKRYGAVIALTVSAGSCSFGPASTRLFTCMTRTRIVHLMRS